MLNHRNIYSGLVLSALLSAMPLLAHADEVWNINYAKSHFGPGVNTLILERGNKPAGPDSGAGASGAAGTFLVISNDKIYMAVDDEAAASGNGVKKVDYTRWRDMHLVQIGDNVHNAGLCGFRCQAGVPETTVTLRFTAHGTDPSEAMRSMVAVRE